MRQKHKSRIKRHKRIRKKILGNAQRPRLCVYKGLANLHAQLIDDINQKTLLSISTQDKDIKKSIGYGGNVKAAGQLGEILAQRAKNKGIKSVVFDRGGFMFHGRIKAFTEAARKHDLQF